MNYSLYKVIAEQGERSGTTLSSRRKASLIPATVSESGLEREEKRAIYQSLVTDVDDEDGSVRMQQPARGSKLALVLFCVDDVRSNPSQCVSRL